MDNFKRLFKKRSSVGQMLNNLTDNLVLSKIPTPKEFESNMKLDLDPSRQSYRIKDRETNYVYQNGKTRRDGGRSVDSELKFENSYKIPKAINKNTPIDPDFPSSFNLPVPNPSTLKYLGTGNGKGGEIFHREQVKIGSDLGLSIFQPTENRNYFRDNNGSIIERRFNMDYRDAWDAVSGMAKKYGPYLPTRIIGNASQISPKSGALVGALTALTAGGIGGALYNTFTKHKRIDPETGEEASLLKDILYGAGIGGTAGGFLGYALGNDEQNAKTASAFGGFSDVAMINNKIMGDPTLDFQQRRQLMNLINQLPGTSISQLAPVVGSALGAGVGAIIAKYLLKMGITGTIITSILGSRFGSSLASHFYGPKPDTFSPFSGTGFLDNTGQRI